MGNARPTGRVLIVEDETIVQMHLAELVRDLGYELSGTAASGSDAIARAADAPPDVVLMDVRIPGETDGIETARELQARHGVAVVFVTAYADEATVSRIEAAGASGYVIKPFRLPEIRVALSTALRGRDVRRQLEDRKRSLDSILDSADAASGASLDRSPPRRRAERRGHRALLYSHDTFGLGHLRRSVVLARALLRRDPHLSLLLATGSPAAHRFELPAGMDYVKLPAVKKVDVSRYAARSLEVSEDEITTLRRNMLIRACRDYEPDLLIVDHAPAGMGGEMLPALEWLRSRGGVQSILGMRDVIDDPQSVQEAWSRHGTHAVLEELYDQILIYGMQDVFDPVEEYGFSNLAAAKTQFVGYVTDATSAESEAEASFFDALPRPLVVVTIGGGDGAAELVHCWLEMLRRHRSRVDFWSVVLTGPLLPAPLARELTAAARGLPVTLRMFVPSTRAYTSRSDLVVCTAGYNTMTEVLAVAPRALVVPRILHRNEQWLRAERLAGLGLVEILHPSALDPERLLDSVCSQLASANAPLRDGRAVHRIHFEGADRAAQICFERLDAPVADAGGSA